MRRVTHGDMVTVARHLLRLAPELRAAEVAMLRDRAQAADLYARRFRRPHGRWGDSTLAAVLGCVDLPPEPPLGDPDYLACLSCVLAALSRGQPRTQEMQRGRVGSRSRRAGGISSPQSVQ